MKSAEEIYREMCSNYVELTGVTVRDGCDMAVRLYAAAAQIESLYAYNDWVKAQCFPQTATGEYLDNHAVMRGLRRIDAVCSKGVIKFFAHSTADVELSVPANTVCLTASGVRFVTTESGIIAVGGTFCECEAIAVEAGESGNVSAETIVFMQQPPIGIASCVNEGPFSGGTEMENDDSLRERILAAYISLPNGANAAYYEKLALSVSGVEAVRIIPKKRGVGTVDIIITSTDGIPEDGLVGQVLDIINESREICVDIQVYAPAAKTIDIQVSIEAESGYDGSKVVEDVKLTIIDYFNGKLLGCDVLKAKLGNIIYGVEGVRNYSISLPVDDFTVREDELPVLGNLSVEQQK